MNELGLPFADGADGEPAGDAAPPRQGHKKKKKAESAGDGRDKQSFEDALKRLETIVGEMESGQLGLEDSIKRFEEGSLLAQLCGAKLRETEKRIEILTKNGDGEDEWQPLPEAAGPAIPGVDEE